MEKYISTDTRRPVFNTVPEEDDIRQASIEALFLKMEEDINEASIQHCSPRWRRI